MKIYTQYAFSICRQAGRQQFIRRYTIATKNKGERITSTVDKSEAVSVLLSCFLNTHTQSMYRFDVQTDIIENDSTAAAGYAQWRAIKIYWYYETHTFTRIHMYCTLYMYMYVNILIKIDTCTQA